MGVHLAMGERRYDLAHPLFMQMRMSDFLLNGISTSIHPRKLIFSCLNLKRCAIHKGQLGLDTTSNYTQWNTFSLESALVISDCAVLVCLDGTLGSYHRLVVGSLSIFTILLSESHQQRENFVCGFLCRFTSLEVLGGWASLNFEISNKTYVVAIRIKIPYGHGKVLVTRFNYMFPSNPG